MAQHLGPSTQAAPLPAHVPPHRWAQRHVSFSFRRRPGFSCCLTGEARLPLPALLVWELLTHPHNADKQAGRLCRFPPTLHPLRQLCMPG